MYLSSLDLIIISIYCISIISIATYVSRKPTGLERSAEDYFLAGRSLPWWAIGASLIAANISAEQIIGMSGQGFVLPHRILIKKSCQANFLGYVHNRSVKIIIQVEVRS